MKCPKCGLDMANKSRCLRCGYTVKDVVLIDPEKIEKEEEPKEVKREINPEDVRVSRAGGNIFDSLFGGFFGGSMFGGLFDSLFGEPEDTGYEYDPKYYDDFGNEIYVPDEFERESVVIDASEITVEHEPKKEERKAHAARDGQESKKTHSEDNRSGAHSSGKGKNGGSFREKVSDKVRDVRDKIRRKPNDKRPPN